MTLSRISAVALTLAYCLSGCRFSYEVLDEDDLPSLGGSGPGGVLTASDGGATGSSGGSQGSGATGGTNVGGTAGSAGNGSAGNGAGGTIGGSGGAGTASSGGVAGTGGVTGTGGTAGRAGTGGSSTTAGGAGGTGSGGATTGSGGTGSGGATTGSGGTGSGGATTGSGGTGGAATTTTGAGGTGGLPPVGDYVVNTETDEDDGPGAGNGLSLREAIQLANVDPGRQTITFASGVSTIAMGSLGAFPIISDAAYIFGGGVVIDATAKVGNAACLSLQAADIRIEGLEIVGCQNYPIFTYNYAGLEIEDCVFVDSGDSVYLRGGSTIFRGNVVRNGAAGCVEVFAPGALIQDNRIFDCVWDGIFLDRTANGVQVIGNLTVRAFPGIGFSGLNGATVWFNSVVGSKGYGVIMAQADQVDFRNNLLAYSDTHGMSANDGRFSEYSHNLFFGNTDGPCNGCSTGASPVTGDPLFVNPTGNSAADFQLQSGSAAIDTGLDVGVDRNAPGGLNYSGDGQDIGFWESN